MVCSTLGSGMEERTEETEIRVPAIEMTSSMGNTDLTWLHFLYFWSYLSWIFFFLNCKRKASFLSLARLSLGVEVGGLNKSQKKLYDQPAIPLTDNPWEKVEF